MTEVWLRAALWLGLAALFESLRRQAQERQVELRAHVLTVVGHRGRSAIHEWVSGSTSHRIVTHARCRVLVVRAR